MNLAIENEDFELVPDPSDDQAFSILITKGQYYGIQYRYNVVKVEEVAETGEGILTYDYTIQKKPEDTITDIHDFEHHVGWILQSLITTLAQSGSAQYTDEEGNVVERSGNSDTPRATPK